MAVTIQIVCPECKRQVKAPDSVLGKKVRCKFCQASFVASKPAAGAPAAKAPVKPGKAPVKPGKAPAKPGKPKKSRPDDEEENANPYDVTNLDLAYRCPHCAHEMESEEAVVCLNCGYNTQTRMQGKMTKTFDITTGEQFVWLLPGIFCVLGIIAVLIFDIWYLMKIDDLIDRENDSWYIALWAHHGIKTWVVIMSLFVFFFCGRFAIKRLILHHAPPEVEKLK